MVYVACPAVGLSFRPTHTCSSSSNCEKEWWQRRDQSFGLLHRKWRLPFLLHFVTICQLVYEWPDAHLQLSRRTADGEDSTDFLSQKTHQTVDYRTHQRADHVLEQIHGQAPPCMSVSKEHCVCLKCPFILTNDVTLLHIAPSRILGGPTGYSK